jgi:hypothetical protein
MNTKILQINSKNMIVIDKEYSDYCINKCPDRDICIQVLNYRSIYCGNMKVENNG